jgi:hypothetical protein
MLNLVVGATTVLAAVATKFAPKFTPSSTAYLGAGFITGVTETATGIGGPPLALVHQHHPAPTPRATIAQVFHDSSGCKANHWRRTLSESFFVNFGAPAMVACGAQARPPRRPQDGVAAKCRRDRKAAGGNICPAARRFEEGPQGRVRAIMGVRTRGLDMQAGFKREAADKAARRQGRHSALERPARPRPRHAVVTNDPGRPDRGNAVAVETATRSGSTAAACGS